MPPRPGKEDRTSLLQGTLDMLILRMLVLGSEHGQGIARLIQQQSDDVFLVDHGSLYLALQRLEEKGWIGAKWGVSDSNRKARFYTLTPRGRRELTDRTARWKRVSGAISRILGPEETEA